jgi:trans-aconitate 2-methyltransferase
VTIDTWNPVQYDKFQREREQPFYDLLAMIRPSPGMRVVDLGCGTGKLTRQLHWIENHAHLLARLTERLAPGGQLAFQVPAMHDEVSHLVADELSGEEPFASALGAWRRARTVLAPQAYARLLFGIGFADPQARLIVYPHVLAGPEAVVDWMRGTLLAEYEKHLPPDLFGRFVGEYQARLLPQLEPARPFFFPFKRILCWGQRA